MANGVLHTLKAIRNELAALNSLVKMEFEHLSTALGDVMRDLDDIRKLLPVRKADKRGRRAAHQSTPKP